MQKSLNQWELQPCTIERVLTIPRSVFNALHPYDQLIARSLEKIGKVRIVDEDD